MTLHCDIVRALPPAEERFSSRVAILIPAYNEGAHLASLVERCVALEPAVVLVVNDASLDDTRAVLEGLVGGYRGQERWVRVCALHLTENAGKPTKTFGATGGIRAGEVRTKETESGAQAPRGDTHVVEFFGVFSQPCPGLML